MSDALPDPPTLTNSSNHVDSNNDTVSSHTDTTDKTTPDTKVLVAVPAMSMEALAVVPLNQKARRSELVQRRTRRPFSVSEVEALVQAVEELGTGRCDVLYCLLAFVEIFSFLFKRKFRVLNGFHILQMA